MDMSKSRILNDEEIFERVSVLSGITCKYCKYTNSSWVCVAPCMQCEVCGEVYANTEALKHMNNTGHNTWTLLRPQRLFEPCKWPMLCSRKCRKEKYADKNPQKDCQ